MKAVSNARKRGDNRLTGDNYLLIYDVSTKSIDRSEDLMHVI